jgi:hypothetical protein
MLWRAEDGAAVVDARVVAPAWRGDWPNLLLLESGARQARAEGLERLQFHCDDDVADTLSLARRCGAREMPPKARFYYAIAG